MIGTIISKISVDLLAIYFAYNLLSCDLADKKWVLYLFILLHFMSLLLGVTALIIYTSFRDVYNKVKTPNNISKSDINSSKSTIAIVGIILTLYLILSIGILFIDLYFLYKLYQCHTDSFIIYILVVLLSGILQILKL